MENVLCCFCNKKVDSTNIDPCDLNILTNCDKSVEKQKNQTFWCHLECFKEKLHIDVRRHFVLDLLNYENEN